MDKPVRFMCNILWKTLQRILLTVKIEFSTGFSTGYEQIFSTKC